MKIKEKKKLKASNTKRLTDESGYPQFFVVLLLLTNLIQHHPHPHVGRLHQYQHAYIGLHM